ncbi:MAG: GNAT family N-acetyltransferase [Maridesulfovibrio ferrireducens]|nr:GNAT family N-acetyltransferase [Maridesulfovibrio ferrireducens]
MVTPEVLPYEICFLTELVFDDVKKLCSMTAQTGFFSEEEVLIVEELAWASISEGEKSGYHFLLVLPQHEGGANPLGFACYGPIPGTKDSWDLYWIVVDEKVQGCGYGRRIIKEVESRIRAVDGRKIFLETSSREEYSSTRGFYESSGYVLESRLLDYYDRGEDCIIFVKELI